MIFVAFKLALLKCLGPGKEQGSIIQLQIHGDVEDASLPPFFLSFRFFKLFFVFVLTKNLLDK